MTLVAAQPLGGSSLEPGQIEIIQDRRLAQDDERGLGQGILDNQPVTHIFRIIVEKIDLCDKPVDEHPAGFLTLQAFKEYQYLLNPLDKFIFVENDWVGVKKFYGADHEPVEDDIEIVAVRNLNENNTKHAHRATGIVVHRTNVVHCIADEHRSGAVRKINTFFL